MVTPVMEVLVFPSEEALQVAMRSGLVPPDVQREPARYGVTPDGLVELAASVTAKVKKALGGAGVEVREASVALTQVSCWAEALKPTRIGEPTEALQQVLFTVAGERTLLELAGELLRLGCDRQELRALDGSQGLVALVKVVEAPWFVLSRALDHLDGLRAFVPTTPGQERLWTEVGWAHPLQASLEAPDDGLVLMTGDAAWWRIAEGEWIDVDQLVGAHGPRAASRLGVTPDAPKVQVTLTLARAARPEAPTLFVLPNGQPGRSRRWCARPPKRNSRMFSSWWLGNWWCCARGRAAKRTPARCPASPTRACSTCRTSSRPRR